MPFLSLSSLFECGFPIKLGPLPGLCLKKKKSICFSSKETKILETGTLFPFIFLFNDFWSFFFFFLITKQRLFRHPGTLWGSWLGSESSGQRGNEVPVLKLGTRQGKMNLRERMTSSSLDGMVGTHFGILNSASGQESLGESWRPRASSQVWAGGLRSK